MPSRITSTAPIPSNPAAPAAPETAAVLDVPLALTDYERTLDWIDASVASDTPATSASRRCTR